MQLSKITSAFLIGLIGFAAAAPAGESPAKPTSTATLCSPVFLCIDGIDECGKGWGGCYDICKPWMKPTAPAKCSGAPKTTSKPTAKTTPKTTPKPTLKKTTRKTPGPPTPTPVCRPRTKCVTGMNGCGVRYGACYDECIPSLSPAAPPCPSTKSSTVTTRPPVPTTTPAPPKDDCRTRTVCVDAVNSCGQKYGGCFADCKPWPLTPPPCPTTSTSAKKTTTKHPRPTPPA